MSLLVSEHKHTSLEPLLLPACGQHTRKGITAKRLHRLLSHLCQTPVQLSQAAQFRL